MSESCFLSASWAPGCLYLAAYGAWARFFRTRVDPWARRRLGERLGVAVGWVRATRFPLEIWVWGFAGVSEGDDLLESRVTLASVALCLAGAFLPTAALCLVLRYAPRLAEKLGWALYLTTPLLIFLFVASHMGWRDAAAAGSSLHGDDADARPPGRGDSRCRPPASLDTRGES